MFPIEYKAAKKYILGKIISLKNDFQRAYYPIKNVQPAPFPITMYAMAIVDLISSFEAGWNEVHKKLKRNQTDRMVNFLTKNLHYSKKHQRYWF